MASQFKFYVHYEQEPSFTHKFVWEQSSEETVEVLLKSFVTAYNETNGASRALDSLRLQLTRDSKPLGNTVKVSSSVKEGDDLYAVDHIPLVCMLKRLFVNPKGCALPVRQKCTERILQFLILKFHPGDILFHEGLKGWKCCQKREIDFNDALKIPGCATGRHVIAPVPLKGHPKPQQQSVVSDMNVHVSGDKEVYSDKHARTKTTTTKPTPAPAPPLPVQEEEIPDPPDAVIPVGAPCVHTGCSATYRDGSSRTEKCEYHPGIAIFHEGSKGWSCCKAKALEFDELFKIEGCTEGVHKFIKAPPKPAQLRRDFYIMGDWVVVSFYSKNVKPGSTVSFEERKFKVKFDLADGSVYEEEVPISHPCDPAASKFSVLSTKVEVKLRKTTEDWDPFRL